MTRGSIRIGIGGWSFPEWRGPFYPTGLPHARELAYVGEHLGATEINATFHKLQSPESFASWARQVPDRFMFAVKASRFCTNRKVLADAGEGIARFMSQGLVELGDKLGPILWQFMPTKKFDADDFGAFLKLLPGKLEGRPVRHVVEVRHESFACAAFVALARKYDVAICFADKAGAPTIADQTADFTYARLQAAEAQIETGYPSAALDRWAGAAKAWAAGRQPVALATIEPGPPTPDRSRDVFLFFINGAKVRAPAAAQALMQRL